VQQFRPCYEEEEKEKEEEDPEIVSTLFLLSLPIYLSIYLSYRIFLSFFLSFCELFHLFNIVRWMASVIQHCLRSAGVHTYDDSDQTSTQDGKQQHQDEQENKEKH